MIQYLIILLDDTSVSFCHYGNGKTVRRLMPLNTLKAGILYGMKENLNIQFVYPDYELPEDYREAIDSIDHTKIMPVPMSCADSADTAVLVVDGIAALSSVAFDASKVYGLRTGKAELFSGYADVCGMLGRVARLNVVITDADRFTDEDFGSYKTVLEAMSATLELLYAAGRFPQVNLLTDRMQLTGMNNCGAGDTCITLAPDGKFYVCPAFYLAGDEENYGLGKAKFSVGDVHAGPDIRNKQLYRLDHAPLCSSCDAYQCRRCVWLNRKATLEVNTPGHGQCVMAHLERNASRMLLANIRKHGEFLPDKEIGEISYLDPFDVREKW